LLDSEKTTDAGGIGNVMDETYNNGLLRVETQKISSEPPARRSWATSYAGACESLIHEVFHGWV